MSDDGTMLLFFGMATLIAVIVSWVIGHDDDEDLDD